MLKCHVVWSPLLSQSSYPFRFTNFSKGFGCIMIYVTIQDNILGLLFCFFKKEKWHPKHMEVEQQFGVDGTWDPFPPFSLQLIVYNVEIWNSFFLFIPRISQCDLDTFFFMTFMAYLEHGVPRFVAWNSVPTKLAPRLCLQSSLGPRICISLFPSNSIQVWVCFQFWHFSCSGQRCIWG